MGHEQAGFTLVEILIALAIMSLLMLLTNSAFFSISRSSLRIADSGEYIADLRLLTGFLDRQLSHIRPLAHRENDDLEIYFSGFSDRIRFTGTLPAHRGGGGLHFLEIGCRDFPAALVLSDTPARIESRVFEDGVASSWTQTALTNEVRAMTIHYFGVKDDETSGWHGDWLNESRLPELIKLEFELGGGRTWPPLVVALHTSSVANQPNLVWQ